MEQRRTIVKLNGNVFSAIFLGICLIISASIIGGKLNNINKAINAKDFADEFPSSISVENKTNDSTYMTQDEAANYLSLSSTDIVNMVTSGQIKNYITNSEGIYIISKESLDNWFDTYSGGNTTNQ